MHVAQRTSESPTSITASNHYAIGIHNYQNPLPFRNRGEFVVKTSDAKQTYI